MSKLPIDEILPDLLQVVRGTPNTILHAPPGAGKTTRVPLVLLDIIPPQAGRIVMLEPRRLAAVSAARWMASLLGEQPGRTVGYSIRFESRVSPDTRIEVVTEGILTRRIQHDPLLEGVAMVIFDEFHERNLQADLGLALCLDVQRQVREDLKLLIMSATLDTTSLTKMLGNAPVVSSPGRSFPVEEIYLDAGQHESLTRRMVSAICRVVSEAKGDILAFLPGSGEIRGCAAMLAESGIGSALQITPLYGDMPFSEQQKAILPGNRRKVVLATAIAETSLTIEGIRVVIDCGLSRRVRFDHASAMNRLVTVRESRASAEQRKGRAGRLGPGVCYRLFSRHTLQAMTPHTPAEMLEADLSALLLELKMWGCGDPSELNWLEPPSTSSIEAAERLLRMLGALDNSGRLTPVGREMAGFPLHPRLARLLLQALENGVYGMGCDLTALLSERDIIRRHAHLPSAGVAESDIVWRLDLLRRWREHGCCDADADIGALKSVDRIALQLRRMKPSRNAGETETCAADMAAVLLLNAYPDRLGRRRDDASGRYLLTGGCGARFGAAGALAYPEYLLALNLGGNDPAEGVIHLGATLDERLIREHAADLIERHDRVSWDASAGRVTASREERIGAVTLSQRTFSPNAASIKPIVLQALRESCLNLLRRDQPFLQLQARLLLLKRCFPDGGWPDVTDGALLDSLETWLGPYLDGVATVRQLAELDCGQILINGLDYQHRQMLDQLAPLHLAVPSGSRIKLDYCSGEVPVLAVKLQEMFGLAETPAIAGGRVKLLLHLLSPAGRPIQVTADLKGFWDGAYHEVKKELKGRYPKHPWPDDPWKAMPTRKIKSKT